MSEPTAPCRNCGRPVTSRERFCPDCGQPEPAQAPYVHQSMAMYTPPPPPRRPWLVVIPLLALLVVVALAAGVVLRQGWFPASLFAHRTQAPAPLAPGTPTAVAPTAPVPTRASTRAPSTAPSTATYGPVVRGSLTHYARAHAPSTSPPSEDGFHNRITYGADNMLDDDPDTCWRMEHKGTSRTLTFRLDHVRPISTLGLVNGYAKVDPATGEDRYSQERRITRVTWTLGSRDFVEYLEDDERQPQSFTLDKPITTDTVMLRIDQVTKPGDPRFDRTAISDVVIAYE